jgi:hypothetical protein
MPIDDRTPGRSYQLPNLLNLLVEDWPRLRAALAAIDADIVARPTLAEVNQLIGSLIAGSPGALDTLNELAAAMGDDPNFAATLTTQLGLKANLTDVWTRAQADARYVTGSTQVEMVFIATADQSAFTLTTPVINKPSALVSVGGVIQPGSEYSLNMTGTVLTLSEGVPVGTIVRVLVLGVASTGAPADDTVTTQKLRAGAVTMSTMAFDGGPLSGTRNRFVNGDMRIDQRNNGAAQLFIAGVGAYSVDRWVVFSTGANVTGQQVQGPTANQYRYAITGAPGVSSISFDQRIEAINSADMAGGFATFSIELANSTLGLVDWDVEYAGNTDDFFVSQRIPIASGVFVVSPTVQRHSATIAIPAAATTGILVRVSVDSQTSGTFTIGNAQFESGVTPTPFERRGMAQELAACQRYYERDGNCFIREAGGAANVFFTSDKRVIPSIAASYSASSATPSPYVKSVFFSGMAPGAAVTSWAATAEL